MATVWAGPSNRAIRLRYFSTRRSALVSSYFARPSSIFFGTLADFCHSLIYLNDDFKNGQTTFFMPSSEAIGVMDARPVKPRQGSILVFPHGETHALLHEGSPVTEGGKFVIRTDVLYTN